jgi:hypothetical protein
MSGVTSGTRLPRSNAAATPRLTLGTALGYLFGGLAIVAIAWLFALFGGA